MHWPPDSTRFWDFALHEHQLGVASGARVDEVLSGRPRSSPSTGRYERISVEPFREPLGAEASAEGFPAGANRPDEVSEAAPESSMPRARTNCEATVGYFAPLWFDLSQDGQEGDRPGFREKFRVEGHSPC
jgi:hypothetical protein